MVTIKCAECGKVILRTGRKQKYCPECSYAVSKRRGKEYRQRLKNEQATITLKCAECGEEFTPNRRGGSNPQKYCSKRCCNLARLRRLAERKEAERRREEYLRELAAKPLNEWLREAAECNLDYGNYRALRQAGKTYDELKATVSERRLQVHNSTSHQHFLRI